VGFDGPLLHIGWALRQLAGGLPGEQAHESHQFGARGYYVRLLNDGHYRQVRGWPGDVEMGK
jgi:hypothetical protein